ncbi:phage integrase SAM-like domain-containing protein [Peribacillus huizhouensis]|uniref:Integrase/recombinase XerD n=1 Tax=Peribacillus huizhouensis TaxID=1501239 RepID=A0ABR6CW22_9BACI|nr:phage integrase SAM-like domain-containing protein [Peribacillus huizhouensis]MBA9029169.1 integrase/recombinase XerD [Peribacillus huizhouensis]
MLLKFAYQDFIDDRKFKNTTKVNIQNYKVLLGGFIDYCHENKILNVEEIESRHVKRYLMYCQSQGNSANTINTKLHRIRAFLNYMVEEGMARQMLQVKLSVKK